MTQPMRILQAAKVSEGAMIDVQKACRLQIFLDVLNEIKDGKIGVERITITLD